MVLIIRNARELVCVSTSGQRVKKGSAMADLCVLPGGAVVVRDKRIEWVGPTKAIPSKALRAADNVIDARDRIVLPGLVDCHTHAVFAGTCEDEFDQRLRQPGEKAGERRAPAVADAPPIQATVDETRTADKDQLIELASRRLDRMLALGTTTVEVKSGYGLTVEHELKLLQIVAALGERHAADLVPTFLGAHVVPAEFAGRREAYVQVVIEEMLPAVAADNLAEFCDVLCSPQGFGVEEARMVLEAAAKHGLRLTVHAEGKEAAPAAAQLAGELGAVSVSGLTVLDDGSIASLSAAGTVAILLPGSAFYLGLSYGPARTMIDAGLPVALATNCNPQTSMTENLPLMGTLAAVGMRMDPAEIVTAMTLNAAAAVGRSDRIGSIEPGKQADLVLFDIPTYRQLPYHFGVNHVWKVIKAGDVVVGQ